MPASAEHPQEGRDQERQEVAAGDLVITWYDDEPVEYGGDEDGQFSTLTFRLLDGGPPVRKCAPHQVAPASVPIPDRDPRVAVAKRSRAEMPYGAAGFWLLTLPGQQPAWHRTKTEGTAAGLRQLAILDWHAARTAQPGTE